MTENVSARWRVFFRKPGYIEIEVGIATFIVWMMLGLGNSIISPDFLLKSTWPRYVTSAIEAVAFMCMIGAIRFTCKRLEEKGHLKNYVPAFLLIVFMCIFSAMAAGAILLLMLIIIIALFMELLMWTHPRIPSKSR